MNVSYVDPLRRAYDRMVLLLFRPFRLQTWFVLGFAAFLSELTTGGSSGGRYKNDSKDIPTWNGAAETVTEFLREPFWTALTIGVGVGVICLAVLALWASSRGKLVFVENVVQGRASFAEPWRRLARLGNSLFWWWLVFAFVVVVLVLAASSPIWPTLGALRDGDSWDPAYLPVLLLTLALEAPVVLCAVLVGAFTGAFAVPLMYLHDIGPVQAWSRLLGLIVRRAGSFILFTLFTLVLWMVIAAAVLVLGFATCCAGFLLLAIPYIGTVVVLPVHTTMRAFSLEFLAQFGPEYSVFAQPPRVDGTP